MHKIWYEAALNACGPFGTGPNLDLLRFGNLYAENKSTFSQSEFIRNLASCSRIAWVGVLINFALNNSASAQRCVMHIQHAAVLRRRQEKILKFFIDLFTRIQFTAKL